jgi:hypothetical protein
MVLLRHLRVRFSDVPLYRPTMSPYEQTTVVCGLCGRTTHNKNEIEHSAFGRNHLFLED